MEDLKARVVLVGAARVGKTSLVRRYVPNAFDEQYRLTLGVAVSKRAGRPSVTYVTTGRPLREALAVARAP